MAENGLCRATPSTWLYSPEWRSRWLARHVSVRLGTGQYRYRHDDGAHWPRVLTPRDGGLPHQARRSRP